MRFHSKEQHEELMNSVIQQHRIMKRIQDLQEARVAGCRTAAEASKFIQEKRRKEAEEVTGPSSKVSDHLKGEADSSPHGLASGAAGLHPTSKELSSSVGKHYIPNPLEDWDISGFPGADLLSESEKHLCGDIRILPAHYLNILQVMSTGIMKGTIAQKSDAYSLFQVEPGKLDKVYDMLILKGIAQA
uniref:Uncharacterized protein n=1 Tax=Rhizophora mucronata TaxID=61149 RepID=A0A2P2L1B5_RHIMU